LTCVVVLKTLWHYRASVWCVEWHSLTYLHVWTILPQVVTSNHYVAAGGQKSTPRRDVV